MDLQFKPFDNKTGIEEYLELFKDAFPEVTDNSENGYFWQMHSFPSVQTHSYEYSAHIGNEMVGYYAAILYRYKILSENVNVGMVCGVMTSSKHRGKGIFTKLGAYSLQDLKEKVAFTTGFPIRKEVIPGHLKVGWKIAFELPLYMKFINVNSFLRTKAKFLLFLAPVANFAILIYNLILNEKYKSAQYQTDVTDYITNYEEIKRFEEQWITSKPISLVRDETFLKWRYGRPGASYRFITVKKGNDIRGFCSYRKIIKEGVPSYGIMDLRVLDENHNALKHIFHTLQQEAKKEKVEILMLMISNLYAKKYKLIKNGFLKSPFKFNLILNNLQKEFNEEFLYNEHNWHLMWVDSDDL